MSSVEDVLLVGQRFRVLVTSRDHEVFRHAKGRLGHMELADQAIYVRDDLAPDQLRDTLMHECLHALLSVMGGGLSDDQEETVVSTLSPVLLDALRRNPAWVHALMEGAW